MNRSVPRRPARPPESFPAWLSATCLLVAVVLAWFILRAVIPLPDGLALPAAVVCICLGLATWWPGSAGPFARGKSLRPFGVFDLFPLASAVLGAMLLFAAFLGWGARPLELAANHVSDLVWGDPDGEKSATDDGAADDKDAGAPATGDRLADWSSRVLPPDSSSENRPDAPPLLLTFQSAEDLARWKNRVVYVRVAALELPGPFGGDWSPLPVEPAALADADDGLPDGQVTNPEAVAAEDGMPVSWTIFSPTDTTIVPSLAGLRTLRAESVNRQAAAVWNLPAPSTGFGGTSIPLVAGGPEARLPAIAVPGGNGPLLSLPEDRAGDMIRALARDFDRTLTIRDLAAAVPNWLAARCRYDEVYSNPNELPVLIQFLEVGRAGICEHFATSGVLLFRALGLPSRIAYGYAGGTLAESSRRISFGARDFHAWAEILVPGLGWVVVECTPPGAGAARPPEPSPEATAPPPDAPPPESSTSPVESWKTPAAVAASAFFLFLLAWLAARWRMLARANRDNRNSGAGRLPQPAWFQEFLAACDRLGAPRRAGRTAREHLEFLRRARLCDDRIEDMIAHYHAVRYDGKADHRAAEMSRLVATWLDHHLDRARANPSREK